MHDIKICIQIYHSGENFLCAVENGVIFDIVFMDIQMDGKNGIIVGQQFRESVDRDDVMLIYISSHDIYSERLLDIGNVRFIKKPFTYDEVDKVFNRALSQVFKYKEKAPNLFHYKLNTDVFSVDTELITYLKVNNKITELYKWVRQNKEIISTDKFYLSLSATLEQLPNERFIQCERSHIINLAYVRQMRNAYFSLIDINNTTIPIGKTYRQKVREAFFRYKSALM